MNKIFFTFILCAIFYTFKGLSLHKEHSQELHPARKQVYQALKLYRKDDQIQKQINQIVNQQPQTFSKHSCSNSKNYGYLVIDTKVNEPKIKKQIVITCNVHARQILVSQVCMEFIKQISQTLKTKTPSKNKQKDNQFDFDSVNQLLTGSRISIFYRGNVQRDKIISGPDYCIRKDENNIDLNRNFPTFFNLFNISKDRQQYPGQKALSEPFSLCLDNYLQQINKTHRINIFVDIHTGEFTLFDSFTSKSIKGFQTFPLLHSLKQKYCPQCRITSIGDQNDDQKSDGQIFPDVKERYKADHSVLLQIYGGYNANLSNNQNCVAIFNPLSLRELDYYKQIWKNGLLYFLKLAIKKLR